ncbi:MAG: pyruvate carboxyltransferase [Ruminococcaceae bacterium]|nr:pyruvate carboxyltransferase [Oscillospiraceae bacterium]
MQPWKTDKWFTSPWNFDPEATANLNFADKILLHDVTLRDGEQQAGIVFTKDDKIAIAEQLAELGVHRIEAGMPAVSDQDRQAVYEIAKRNLGPEIYSFARCTKGDVDLALDCGCKGIVCEIPCSEHSIINAYRWPVEKAIQQSIDVTNYAHEKGLRVVFFTIDCTRADPVWFINTVKRIGAEGHMDALTLADTVGGLNPHGAYTLVKTMKKHVDVPIEVHFHDDFGMGAANTVFGLAAGAEVAHTCITGIGERAGNTPYEDLVMTLLCTYNIDLGLNTNKMRETAKLMQKLSGLTERCNRPIIGDSIFHVESGIVASWVKNLKSSMLGSYGPELVGHDPISIRMGKKAGAPNIEMWLERMGRPMPDKDTVKLILNDVKDYAFEVGRELTEDEFVAIVEKY